MMRNPKFATWVVSGYLVVYCVLLGLGTGFWRAIAVQMFFFSPVFVGWMAYTIVRFGRFTGEELAEGEEFGYNDRCTSSLGVW